MPAGPILFQQLIAQQLAAQQAAKAAAPTPAMVPEGASKPNDFSGKDGLFGRLFPDRDPNTGAQGGILANPLFRLGLNLLQRSGPQARPHSLGQDIAGSVQDYSNQRDTEVGMQDAAIQGNIRRQGWNDLQGQVKFGDQMGNPEDLMALFNPSGNPDAVKAQTPNAGGSDYYTRLAGLESGGNPNAQNKLSSASGPFQFIDSTRKWVDEQGKFNPLDRSPEMEKKRAEFFTGVNEKNLAMNGLEVNDATRYISHLLGSKGAKDFLWALKQDPSMSAEQRLGSEVVSKNSAVFKGKTLQQAYDKIANAIGAGSWAEAQPQTQPTVEPPVQSQVVQSPAPIPMVAPTPQAPAQFSQGQASGPPTSLAPPQGAQPSPPPVGSAPGTPQAQAAPPVSAPSPGPTPPPTGDQPQGPTIPAEVLKPGPGGGLSKASMVEALGILPPAVRNATILGAWMKAVGNKRLFAQYLGESLLGMVDDSNKITTAKAIKAAVDKPFQKVDVLMPDGTVVVGSYDPDTGQTYTPDGKGKLNLAPEGSRPTTPGVAAPLNQPAFLKTAKELDEDNLGMQKIDKYMKKIGGTNVGIARWADEISQHVKTLLGTGKLTQQQLDRAIAQGDVQALVGLFRTDVVGPGVMTAQDAIFVLDTLGGDVGMLQNPNVVKERLKLMVDQKAQRMRANLEAYNANSKYYPGYGPRQINIPDTTTWDQLPNMESKTPVTSKYKIEVDN